MRAAPCARTNPGAEYRTGGLHAGASTRARSPDDFFHGQIVLDQNHAVSQPRKRREEGGWPAQVSVNDREDDMLFEVASKREPIDDRFGYWFSGLFDGEGSFILKSTKRGISLYCKVTMKATLGNSQALQRACTSIGCGKYVEDRGALKRKPGSTPGQVHLKFQRFEELKQIIVRFFEMYPLKTSKSREFDVWRRGVLLRSKFSRHRALPPEFWNRFRELEAEFQKVREAESESYREHMAAMPQAQVDRRFRRNSTPSSQAEFPYMLADVSAKAEPVANSVDSKV
jgi:hypothetical protein